MTDAMKMKVIKIALALIVAFIVLWIVVQLAIGANASAEIDQLREHCLTTRNYTDCMSG